MASLAPGCLRATHRISQILAAVQPARCWRWSSTAGEDGTGERRPEPGQVENLMDIGTRNIFTEEHDIFRRTARKFIQEEVIPDQMKYEEQGYVDREVWRKMGAAGMFGTTVSVEYGGAGGEFKYNAIVDEENYTEAKEQSIPIVQPRKHKCADYKMTRSYANDAGTMGWTVHSGIVLPYIEEYGTVEQCRRYLPGMVAGELISAIAMTEPQAGSDLQGIKTTAKRDGDDWILNGSKTFISNGYLCDTAIVVAITDLDAKSKAHGISLFLVDATLPGFTKGKPLKKIGQKAADTAELFFDDIRLPKEALLGGEKMLNKGFYCLMNQLPRERLILGVGVQAHAECMFEMTRDYVKKRKAFGRTISSLQTIQHRLAEMKTELCVSRAFTDRCIQLYCEDRLDSSTASMLKLHTTDLCFKVASECVQLHGGWGYMWEFPIARGFAASRVYSIYAGSNEIMKELIARDIVKDI